MSTKQSTRFPGVRSRRHSTRKHGKRPDECYFIRYRLDGRLVEERVGWLSQKITAAKAYEYLAMLKENQRTGQGPRSFREMEKEGERRRLELASRDITLTRYFEDNYLAYAKRTKKSWAKEEEHFRNHLAGLLGDKPLRRVELRHWDRLVTDLADKGLSPRTMEYITGTLRRIMKHAYGRHVIPHPPPTGKQIGVTAPSNNRRQRVITQREQDAVLSELKVRDLHAWRLTFFAFHTGCRASEAFELEWRNIQDNAVTFVETKNSDPRPLPLNSALRQMVAEMERGRPTERVFTKATGKSYTEAPSSFRTVVDSLGLNEDRERLDRIVFHSIRHTVATRLGQHMDLRSLMDIMGWRVPAMALRYMHGNEMLKREGLEALNRRETKGKVVEMMRQESAS